MGKKGFTLIEILVAIVVLSAILLLAVPKIFTLIDKAKKEAFKVTNSIIRKEIVRENSMGEIIPRVYTFTNGVMSPDIGVEGELPKSGTIEVNSEGKIQILTSNGQYCAIKKFSEEDIAVYKEGDSSCNLTSELALTIDPNGGIYDGSTENVTYQILPDGKLVLETPIKANNVFAGWDVNCKDCLEDDVYTVGTSSDTIKATWELYNNSYTYTGNSTLVEDSPGNWKLKLLTSGTFTPLVDMEIDAFLVGGGGGGYSDGSGNYDILGAGGGYTKTYRIIKLTANTGYDIVIGAGGAAVYNTTSNKGGTTSAFGYSALGGNGGGYIGSSGYVYGNGNGGSGGAKPYGVGGSDGGNGARTDYFNFGLGQGTTTREFEETTGDLYAGGGGNGMGDAGGAGGGGNGRYGGYGGAADPGTPNTGGGGGSTYGSAVAGAGGSGIVVIKKSLSATCVGATNKYCFKYSGKFSVTDGDKDSWKVRFLTTGSFTPYSNANIDAFLVGGGGGGMYNGTQCFDSVGGGGGYTANIRSKSLSSKTSYPVVIGAGGKINYVNQAYTGESTIAFGNTAAGGFGGGCQVGGNGGSGGGYSRGNGGSDGSNGIYSNDVFGVGQIFSTREFGEPTGDLYAGGGGGGYLSANTLGGAGGGGNKGTPGIPNTGGGGGSNSDGNLSGAGGSGIVVIRASVSDEVTWTCIGGSTQYCFTYTGTYSLENETTNNWKIKLLTSGMYMVKSSETIDAFLVGGGGGGGSGAGGGGGGGYTTTKTDISLSPNNVYQINIGSGGLKGTGDGNGGIGKSTVAFGYSVLGGSGGNGWSGSPRVKGGDGGSGGGGGSDGYPGGDGGNNGANGIAGRIGTYGTGQGSTTREFGESTGTLYASGGGAGNVGVGLNGAGSGGNYGNATSALANTGSGGGGSGSSAPFNGGDGGSGIVIIRNS